MKINKKLWDSYGLTGRIWMVEYDEDSVKDALAGVPEDVMESAIKQANYWVYNRRSPNWNYCLTSAVEKQMLRNDPEKYEVRRQAFIRHVLATVTSRHPDVVGTIVEEAAA